MKTKKEKKKEKDNKNRRQKTDTNWQVTIVRDREKYAENVYRKDILRRSKMSEKGSSDASLIIQRKSTAETERRQKRRCRTSKQGR